MEISLSFKSKPKLVFNGKEYGSLDEMPDDVRRLYQSAITLAAKGGPNVKVLTQTDLWFNGKKYNSLDEMPPDVRRVYDEVMRSGRREEAGPARSLFSVVSMVSLIILLVWLVIILRRV
jgi:hypothetical protein